MRFFRGYYWHLFCILSCLTFLFPSSAFASAKVVLGTNENIVLEAKSDLPSPQYEWTLLQEEKVIEKKKGNQYSFIFKDSGLYILNLLATSLINNEQETTQTEILVGEGKSFIDTLGITIQTLPEHQKNSLSLPPENLSLHIILEKSQGDIREYQINADIQKDSDKDGDPLNDIDNENTESYTNGSLFSYTYKKEDLPTVLRATLIDSSGNKATEDINISLGNSLKNKPLLAVLKTYPVESSDKRIYLTGDEKTVSLFAGRSEGDIIEYWIDMNTEEDSDGNGIPNDDIDNKNHPSFKDGSLFSFPLRRVDGDRTVQLTIVSKEGKGSRIQRRFSWVSEEDILHTDSFRLYTSHKAGFTGEPIYFGIDGIKESYGFEIKWDFDGDKKADYTSASPLASFVYEAPGVYTALVQVKHIERSILKYQELEIHITERVPGISQYQTPISNFTVSLSDNLVTLVNTSVIDPNLSENNMKYAWKFGDGSSSFEKNPEHRYQTPGQYIIRLDIEDELGQKHSKQSVVTIQTIAPFLPEESNENPFQEETEDSSDTSNTENTDTPTLPQKEELKEEGTSFLTLFFLGILIILGLSLCMFIGALVYFKIKTPDYTIGEIIEELKERVLSFVEGRPYEPPSEEILSTGNEIKEATERVLQKEEEQNEDEEKPEPITETLEEKTPETPPKKEESDSKIPSWLQENDEEKPENSNTEEDSVLEEDDDDDIPDWLK